MKRSCRPISAISPLERARGAGRRRPRGTAGSGTAAQLRREVEQVVVALEVEQPGDRADDDVLVARGRASARICVARHRRVRGTARSPSRCRPSRTGPACRCPRASDCSRHRVGDADDLRRQRRGLPLEHPVDASSTMRDVDAVNASPWIVWTITGTFARSAAQRPMMPALLLCVWTTSGRSSRSSCDEAVVGAEILDRQDRPRASRRRPRRGSRSDVAALHQRALRPDRGPVMSVTSCPRSCWPSQESSVFSCARR